MRSTRIQAAIKAARGNRKEIIQQIEESIEACLEQEGHKASVVGKEKHLYSIYQKNARQEKILF